MTEPDAARDTSAVTAQVGGFPSTAGEPVPDPFSFEKTADPEWFKRAVFYEVLVRGFADSNGDGTGDLRGLTSKLDYLQWLGIDCLWLPPFYASPLRDGGYDISDFIGCCPSSARSMTSRDRRRRPRARASGSSSTSS